MTRSYPPLSVWSARGLGLAMLASTCLVGSGCDSTSSEPQFVDPARVPTPPANFEPETNTVSPGGGGVSASLPDEPR
ncbi:hypothetical protein LzC2_37290 [Planctomycetes bacterium LzC2]|uniref:Uncharacterized protein n=1 Tax=Alienimonas chondri TaxID=2681879 RepID=A0ABX1VIM2_9PLAN|nr:hypothetical protein [Alienimonas chondri]